VVLRPDAIRERLLRLEEVVSRDFSAFAGAIRAWLETCA
jgi:hypothetical protein